MVFTTILLVTCSYQDLSGASFDVLSEAISNNNPDDYNAYMDGILTADKSRCILNSIYSEAKDIGSPGVHISFDISQNTFADMQASQSSGYIAMRTFLVSETSAISLAFEESTVVYLRYDVAGDGTFSNARKEPVTNQVTSLGTKFASLSYDKSRGIHILCVTPSSTVCSIFDSTGEIKALTQSDFSDGGLSVVRPILKPNPNEASDEYVFTVGGRLMFMSVSPELEFTPQTDKSFTAGDYDPLLGSHEHVAVEYNSDMTDHLMVGLRYSMGATNSGIYFKMTGSDLEVVGTVTLSATNKLGQELVLYTSDEQIVHLPGTSVFYFVGVLTNEGDRTASLFLVDSNYEVGSVGDLDSIDLSLTITPEDGTHDRYVPGSFVPIDPSEGTYLLTGQSMLQLDGGGSSILSWARILKFKDLPIIAFCHDDCATCEGFGQFNCLTCANQNRIFPPSGCSCPEGCLKCTSADSCSVCAPNYALTATAEGGSTCENIASQLGPLQAEIAELESQNSMLKTEVLEKNKEIIELQQSIINDLSSFSGLNQQCYQPWTSVNGVEIKGCVKADPSDGLCLKCANGMTLNSSNGEKADKCISCVVKKCQKCSINQSGIVKCLKCSYGLTLMEDEDGQQTCYIGIKSLAYLLLSFSYTILFVNLNE